MKNKLMKLGAVILLASMTLLASAQQTRPHWPGASPTSRVFGAFWDFCRDQEYNSTDFTTTIVQAGAGSGTVAAEDLLYGTLLFTTDDAAADGNEIQSTNTCAQLTAGKHTVIAARFVTGANATNCLIEMGLVGTDTTFITGHTNGITIRKPDASTTMSLAMVGGGGGTTADYTLYTLNTVAASTSYEYLIDVMPLSGDATKAYVKVWVNGSLVLNRQVSVDVPSVVLTPSAGIQVGATNAVRTMRLDYLGFSQDR